jgi:hypothetical protein
MVNQLKKNFSLENVSLYFLWILIFLSYLLFPAKHDPYGAAGFYLTVIFCAQYLFWLKLFHVFFNGAKQKSSLVHLSYEKIVNIFFILSVFGVICHIYDKAFLRGYDYLSCFDFREQWIKDGVARKGSISSWQSAVGHIFSHFALIPIIFSGSLSKSKDKAKFLISLLVVIIYCWTLLSRSSVILFCLTAIVGVCFLANLHQKKIPLLKVITILSIMLVFTGITFTRKIYCASKWIETYQGYTQSSLRNHNLTIDPVSLKKMTYSKMFKSEVSLIEDAFIDFKEKVELPSAWFVATSKLGYIVNMIALYLTNGINSFTELVGADFKPDPSYYFSYVVIFGKKVGLLPESYEPSNLRQYLAQGFLNFPAAMVFSFGVYGFYLMPLILACLAFLGKHLILIKNDVWLLPLYCLFLTQIILLPLVNLSTLLSTPYYLCIGLLFYSMKWIPYLNGRSKE